MARKNPERAFTLIELLVTMGLMALLATVSIAGYYGAVRGMTERGVRQDVISFLRMTRQRADIDQVPSMTSTPTDEAAIKNLKRMIEELEDNDDVQKVYTNCTIDLYEE